MILLTWDCWEVVSATSDDPGTRGRHVAVSDSPNVSAMTIAKRASRRFDDDDLRDNQITYADLCDARRIVEVVLAEGQSVASAPTRFRVDCEMERDYVATWIRPQVTADGREQKESR